MNLEPEIFGEALQKEWSTKYMPMIPIPVDDETFHHLGLILFYLEDSRWNNP